MQRCTPKLPLALLLLITLFSYDSAEGSKKKPQDKSTYQNMLNDLMMNEHQLFRANKGQWNPDILYQSSGANATASFYQDKVTFSLRKNLKLETVDGDPFRASASCLNWSLSFPNASTTSVEANQPVTNNINYFGPNAKDGVKLNDYREIEYKNIYQNIDLKFYSAKSGALKYDYIVKPGADVTDIRMKYDGIEGIEVLSSGELKLTTPWGDFIEDKPFSYQVVNGKQVEVFVDYQVINGEVSFHINGNYNEELPLVIDPIYVDWSTYFYGETGSSTTWGYVYVLDVDIDDEDNVYICGMAYNQKFVSQLGGYDTTIDGFYDAFVCKVTPKGDSLRYFTYFGGSNGEYAMNISVSSGYQAAISGITWGGGFPTTTGAFDEDGKTCGTGFCWQGFITKFSSDGNKLIFSTFLTGRTSSSSWSIDWIRGMQVTPDGKVYVVGSTTSEDFPVTNGCYQSKYGGSKSGTWWNSGDAFLSCLKADGSDLVFSTYIGGSGEDMGKDLFIAPGGSIYVVGSTSSGNFRTTPGSSVFNKYIKGTTDGFVVKFKPNGNTLEFAKLMGGTGSESFEGIYASEEAEPYIVGNSNSSDFPVSKNAYQKKNAGGYDVVVVKMISAGTNFRYSTYLGGGGDDGYNPNNWWFESASITANVKEEAIIAATSKSTDFPITSDALQKNNNGLSWYGKLTISKLSYTGGDLMYGTYYGGNGGEFPGGIRAKRVGCVTYILSAGNSWSGDYPTTKGVYKESVSSQFWTGFITKFRDTLYTEPISLGLEDSIIECDNVFEIFDAKNQGATFEWSNGVKNRYNIAKDTGLLWVSATYGCDTVRDSIHIRLERSPIVPVFGNDTTYCDNFPTLLLDAKNDTIFGAEYDWHNGSDQQTIWVNQPGKYYVDISTPNCGSKSDTLNLDFLKTPIVTLPTDTIDCDSVTITLDAQNANNDVVYKWSNGDSVQAITAKDTGRYKVVASNFCGADSVETHIVMHTTPVVALPDDSVFCDVVSYILHVGKEDNGETYSWDDVVAKISIGTEDTLLINGETYARITIENTCATVRDSVQVGLITKPTVGIKDTIYTCDVVNELLVMPNTKTNNEEVYSWAGLANNVAALTVSSEGDYTGYVKNKCGIDSSSWKVILKKTPVVALPNDSTYCGTVNVTLDVTDPDDEMEYEWQGSISGPTYNVTAPGTYSVKITNRCGSASDEVKYELLQMPVVDLGDDRVYCGGITATSYIVGDPDNEETYEWSDNTNGTSATFLTEGDHWVVIKNYCGEVGDTVNFRISPLPIVDLGTDTILCGDFELTLDAGNPGMTYLWSPYGETTQTIKATEQITYYVVVTNQDGCEGLDDYRVGTECISHYHIPTSFSPNGDGLNDMFIPTLINFQDYSMSVHNRWGEAIFETNDPNQGWDGTAGGEVVPSGVYLYSIRFITTEDGEFQNVKGLVHVLR